MRPNRASSAIALWLEQSSENDPRTQTILAERLSARAGRRINQSTISAIVSKFVVPKLDLVLLLRDELGIDPDWWVIEEATASGVSLVDPDALPPTGTK